MSITGIIGGGGGSGTPGAPGAVGATGMVGATGITGVTSLTQDSTGRALTSADNGGIIHLMGATGTAYTFLVPVGLPTPFITMFNNNNGTVVVNGATGVSVTDIRSTGSAAPNTCVLIPDNTNVYKLIGGKD